MSLLNIYMRKIKNWNDYKWYSKDITVLSNDLEIFLIKESKGKDRDKALEELIKFNISTVHHYAKKYFWSNLAYEDLVQYGIAGIISAIDNYDYTKSTKFATYCTHYVIGRLKRALEQHNNLIRLPAHVNLALLRITEVDPLVDIADEELKKLTTDRYKLHHLRTALEAKKQKLIDIDEIFDIPNNDIENIDRKIIVDQMLGMLNDKEKVALELKFGLNGHKIHTLTEIDKIIGIDAENLILGIYRKLRAKYNLETLMELLRDE